MGERLVDYADGPVGGGWLAASHENSFDHNALGNFRR
jgi:hypothetical protein